MRGLEKMRNDKRRRQSFNYKLKFWFYCLTVNDMVHGVKKALSLGIELLMCVIVFGLIFLVPALFR